MSSSNWKPAAKEQAIQDQGMPPHRASDASPHHAESSDGGGGEREVDKESSTDPAGIIVRLPPVISVPAASVAGVTLNVDTASVESLDTAKVWNAAPAGIGDPSSSTNTNFRRSLSKESSSRQHHHHHHNSSIRMEDVGFLMREQDADLLESIHRNGPNQTGMTPVLSASRIELDRLSQIPTFSLDYINQQNNETGLGSATPSITGKNQIHVSASAPCLDGSTTPTSSTKQQARNRLPNYYQQQPSIPRSICRSPMVRQSSANNTNYSNEEASATEPNTQQQQQPAHFSPLRLSERQISFPRQYSGGGYSDEMLSYLPEPYENNRKALSGDIFLHEQQDQEGSVLSDRDSIGDVVEDHHEKTCMHHRSESAERRFNEAAQFAEAVGDLPLTEQEDLRIIDETNEEGEEDYDDDDDDDATEVRVERSRMLRPPSKRAVTKKALSTEGDQTTNESAVVIAAAAEKLCHEPPPPPPQQQLDPRSTHTTRSETPSVHIPDTPVKQRPHWPAAQYETRPAPSTTPESSPSRRAAFLAQLPSSTSTQDFVYKGIRANPPEIIKRGTTRGNYAQLHRKAWLEVSDKYHRYGKHLRLYYRYWERLGFPTNMFFDWLDSKGEAAGQPLPELEECPRSQLDSDTVLYITNPDLTQNYALQLLAEETTIVDDDGNEEVMRRGRVVDVDGDPVQTGPDGWIFVLRDNVLYGSQKITSVLGHSKQRFHHSSFFGGKAVAAAGIFLTDDDGFLTRLYPHSGHYRPGEAHVQRVLFFIFHEGIDLRTFEMDVQQIQHVSRDGPAEKKAIKEKKDFSKKENETDKENGDGGGKTDEKEAKTEKKKKTESLQLMPAVLVACFLAHKARFIGEGIFAQIHQIRKAEVASVGEALDVIDNGGYWKPNSVDADVE